MTYLKNRILLPFLKGNKDPSLPKSYRPFSLLSAIGKVIEKLLHNRLYWYLETRNLLLPTQARFRQNRSTIDQLASLEHCIQCGLKEKRVVLVTYFDISKAFDKVPHTAILVKLARLGIEGNSLGWTKSFLEGRTFQAFILGKLSEKYDIEIDVPQGAILSPLLFSVFMSDMPILPGVNYSLFADDLCFYVVADEYDEALQNMQEALNHFRTWAAEWKGNINPDKSYVQYFTRKRITLPILLKYGNVPIPYAKQHKFLGLHFDSPLLTWKTHIEELVRNCYKRLNIMRASSSKAWGADRKTLPLIYKTFVGSKIDYGSAFYGSTCKRLINKLEVIQNAALRTATGALRSTPVLAISKM